MERPSDALLSVCSKSGGAQQIIQTVRHTHPATRYSPLFCGYLRHCVANGPAHWAPLDPALCLRTDVDWFDEAKRVFLVEKPEHFTDFNHCEECADHDETLRSSSVEQIGLEQLGNPGWDPLCFCSTEGLKYYLPALVRLSVETIEREFYFEQLLFHLAYAGAENRLLQGCSASQREFVAAFLAHMIFTYPNELERNTSVEEALSTHELWSKA